VKVVVFDFGSERAIAKVFKVKVCGTMNGGWREVRVVGNILLATPAPTVCRLLRNILRSLLATIVRIESCVSRFRQIC